MISDLPAADSERVNHLAGRVTMPVQILLDQPPTVWTNLDQIKGKVVLRLDNQSSITSIVVKLEGESKTKLVTLGTVTAQSDLGERQRAYEEFHKVGRSWM